MIYIDNDNPRLLVRFPRTCSASLQGAVLEFVSTVDRKSYTIPVTSIDEDGDYFAIVGDFSGLEASGEYEYRLTASDEILASGVAAIGELPAVVREQYESEKEYQQYEN